MEWHKSFGFCPSSIDGVKNGYIYYYNPNKSYFLENEKQNKINNKTKHHLRHFLFVLKHFIKNVTWWTKYLPSIYEVICIT